MSIIIGTSGSDAFFGRDETDIIPCLSGGDSLFGGEGYGIEFEKLAEWRGLVSNAGGDITIDLTDFEGGTITTKNNDHHKDLRQSSCQVCRPDVIEECSSE